MLDLVAENKMNVSVAYIAKSLFVWHAKLGRVNIAFMKRLK